MKYLAIIQARCGSSRLPNKVLKEIEGKPALEHMLKRISNSRLIDEVVVATTYNREDIPIVQLVSSMGFRVFVGSGDDVLDRYYQVARLIKPEYVIRLTADCPLLDPQVVDDAIIEMREDVDDLSMLSETFPDGEDCEILKFSALERAWKEARLMSEREHVTLYVKNHPELFKLQDYKCKLGNLNGERWTLDEPEDLELIKAVYAFFSPNRDFSMREIYNYLHSNPEIRALNQKYIRNEGLQISLKNDREMEMPN